MALAGAAAEAGDSWWNGWYRMTPGGRSEGYHDAEVSTRRSELNGERFLMVRSGTAAETPGFVVVEH